MPLEQPPSLFDMVETDLSKTEESEEATQEATEPQEEESQQEAPEETEVEETEEPEEEADDQESEEEESDEESESETESEEGEGDGKEAGEEQGSSDPRSHMREYLENILGISTEGMSDEQIEQELKELSTSPPATETETVSEPETEEAAAESETEKTAEQKAYERRLKALEKTDALHAYVTFNEAGVAIPRKEFGEKALEAARTINKYQDARRERLSQLADDPLGTLEPDLQAIMDAKIEERINEYIEQQKAAQERIAVENARMTEQERANKFFEENKSELYELDAEGRPRQTGLKNKKLLLSELGKLTEKKYAELQELSPTKPDSELLSFALRQAKEIIEARPKLTAKEKAAPKKKRVLSKSKKQKPEPTPSTNASVATPEERQATGEKTSLLDMILNNPEIEGNPEIAGLR